MTEGPLRASASPLTLRSALEGHSRFIVEDPEAQRFRHFARVTGLVTGRAQNRTYVHFGSKACALLCKKPRFPNFHPFHYYGFCLYRPRTQGKYEEGTSAKLFFLDPVAEDLCEEDGDPAYRRPPCSRARCPHWRRQRRWPRWSRWTVLPEASLRRQRQIRKILLHWKRRPDL